MAFFDFVQNILTNLTKSKCIDKAITDQNTVCLNAESYFILRHHLGETHSCGAHVSRASARVVKCT